MALFITVITNLDTSFLRPVDFNTPVSVKTIFEKDIPARTLRLCRHADTETCNEDEWVAVLRSLVGDTEGENARIMPRGRELNMDKIFYKFYESAAKYFSVTATK